MNIFITHSRGYDFRNELYLPLRNSELSALHSIFLPHESEKSEIVTKDIIKKSDVIVAEVSFPSTGQGIELGWANGYKIPIICIYKRDSHISDSLRNITNRFIVYENKQDMIQQLEKYLSEV